MCPTWLQSLLVAMFVWTLVSALLLRVVHRPTFLVSSNSRRGARSVGLVIAHPDDESMFFVPTMEHLRAQGYKVSLMCLSTGNADGLGRTRAKELRAAARLFAIPAERVRIIDDEQHLADGMRTHWNIDKARAHVSSFVEEHHLDTLITFDAGGVSGHPNHGATFEAVRAFLQHHQKQRDAEHIDAYALQSTPLWRKYAGLADALLSWKAEHQSAGSMHLVASFAPWRSHQAMAAHHSQFVWYRRMFVLFSRYTFINTLERIDTH